MKSSISLRIATTLLVATLPLSSASASFEDASAYIDLDGSMVGYMGFEGDGQEIGAELNDIYQKILASRPEMPPIPVDFTLLIENLGFGSLKAIAMSSKDVEAGLHRNRSAALLNGAPKGLFAIYDLEPLTFTAAAMAPADASAAMTISVNLGALRDTSTLIMQQVMGPMGEGMIQQQLAQIIPETDINYNELIDALSGKWDGFWHQSYREDFQQEFKFWVSIEGAGSLLPRLQAMAEGMGVPFSEDEEGLKANFSSLLGEAAVIGLYVESPKDSDSLIVYSHSDWTPESGGARLADSDAFKDLAKRLPSEGIAFSYSVGADLEPILAGMAAMPQVVQYGEVATSVIDFLLGDFLEPNMAVSYMDGDHMVSDQYASYSTKQMIMAIPAIAGGGMGAAMAIPAFQKVRETSQEKAVTNNLRQIASAADQFFLENGVTEVHIDKLVGEGGYLRVLNPVAGESYEGMVIRQGEDISVMLGDGTLISVEF